MLLLLKQDPRPSNDKNSRKNILLAAQAAINKAVLCEC